MTVIRRPRLAVVLLVLALSVAASLGVAQKAQAWPVGTQGCTLGYWKNHQSAWVTYSPTDTIGSAFKLTSAQTPYASTTLIDGLNFPGGPGVLGAEQILFKQAIAGLLNSTSGIDYGATTAQVIGITHTAILSGSRDDMITVAGEFELRNSVGCPLS